MNRKNKFIKFLLGLIYSFFFFLLGPEPCFSSQRNIGSYANITIEAKELKGTSSAQLFLKDYVYFENCLNYCKRSEKVRVIYKQAKAAKSKMYSIQLSQVALEGPRYASVHCYISKQRSFQQDFIIENGDSIKIEYKNGVLFFSGKSSFKYQCQQLLNDILYGFECRSFDDYEYLNKLDSNAVASFTVLERFKKKMTEEVYTMLKAEIVMRYQEKRRYFQMKLKARNSTFSINTLNLLWNEKIISEFSTSKISASLIRYVDHVITQYETDSCFLLDRRFNFKGCYRFVLRNLDGKCRELAILKIVQRHSLDSQDGDDVESCIIDAINSQHLISDSVKTLVSDYRRWLIPGKTAYDFTLKNIQGKDVRLSNYRGNTVLLDFYSHSCGACRRNFPFIDSIRRLYSPLKFIVISIFAPGGRQTRETWKSLLTDEIYSSSKDINLIDQHLIGSTGDALVNYRISSYPTLILINKKGLIIGSPTLPFIDNGTNLVELIEKDLLCQKPDQ